MKKKIGVFDSGIGGITILTKMMEDFPHEDFIYYSDLKNNPYGEKTYKELIEISDNIIDLLLKKECKIIVIACNTASTVRDVLREKYHVPIIITEPAVKQAVLNSDGNILVMATKATIESDKFKELVAKYNEDRKIYLWKALPLASFIENKQSKEIDKYLKEGSSLYNDDIKAIVLGCTHYPFIKDKIEKYFKQATIFDSSKGVSKQVGRVLKNNNFEESEGTSSLEIICSIKEKDQDIKNIIKEYIDYRKEV